MEAYPGLLETWFSYIERAKTGDPAWAADWAGRDLSMPKERVGAVEDEQDGTGQLPSMPAHVHARLPHCSPSMHGVHGQQVVI